MPELPEVQTVLDGFIRVISGKQIKSVDCFYPGTVLVDTGLEMDPFPGMLSSAFRRGKYMVVILDSYACLIIHLRMTGKLVHHQQLGTSAITHERARINLEGGEVVHFIDPRTFGKIIICPLTKMTDYMPELGLEPLGREFTAKNLQSLLQRRKAPIKSVLLDQKVIAGLGNIYVSEILYRAGIHPAIPASDLELKEISRIIKHSRTVLAEAILKGGTSISDFRRIDDKTGEFQNFLRVYQKKTCPQGHCIERIIIAGRSSFYCPVCQKWVEKSVKTS